MNYDYFYHDFPIRQFLFKTCRIWDLLSKFLKKTTMMKTKWILTLMLLMTGCGEKVPCSAYPEKYLSWMPFQKGDKYSFTDGTTTFQLTVDEVYKTDAYTMKQTWPLDRMCEVEAYTVMTSNSLLSKIEFKSSLPEPQPNSRGDIDTTFVYFRIIFLSEEWSEFGFSIRDGQISPSIFFSSTIPLLSSFNNGYNVYNNVLKLEHDTLISQLAIYQVYIAESVGIIQFKDRKNHKTWSLIGKE
jgi:hypothetical protein